jgi:hypothetical protein
VTSTICNAFAAPRAQVAAPPRNAQRFGAAPAAAAL